MRADRPRIDSQASNIPQGRAGERADYLQEFGTALQIPELANAVRGRSGGLQGEEGRNACVVDSLRQLLDQSPAASDSQAAADQTIREAASIRELTGAHRGDMIAIADAWAIMTASRYGPWDGCPWPLELPRREHPGTGECQRSSAMC